MNKNYIEPVLIQATKLNGINEYINKSEVDYYIKKRNYSEIKYKDILEFERLIVLGEPGCGKSELINQLTEKDPYNKALRINLPDYKEYLENKMTVDFNGFDLICFDALDEVDYNLFSKAVQFISNVSKKFKSKKIFVCCRSYYIQNNLSAILAFMSEFQYLLIDRFNDDQIANFINHSGMNTDVAESMIAKLSNEGGKQLKSVLKIARYLNEICNVIIENKYSADAIKSWKRSDFFDKAIYFQLENEFKDESNKLDLSKRVLEKLALVMEIKRTNRITMDELLSFLDDINSNINLSFLSSVNIADFTKRVMKLTGNNLEFHNTEFQEYLAAKEINRLKFKDQALYDLLIDKDFLHIYSNWYDVLRFLVELSPNVILPLSNFIQVRNNGLLDENLIKLMREADLELLDGSSKSLLFSKFYNYFQSHEIYIQHYDYDNLLVSIYTDESFKYFDKVIEKFESIAYHFRIYNQFKIVSTLIKQNKLSPNIILYWKGLFKSLTLDGVNPDLQNAALYAIREVNDKDILLSIADEEAITKNNKVYRVYLNALGDVCPNNDISIKHFFVGLKAGYWEGIDGLMSITDPENFVDTFTEIFNSEELIGRFFDHNAHIIGYWTLINTIRNLWDVNPKVKLVVDSLLRNILKERHFHIFHSDEEFIQDLLTVVKSKNKDYIFQFIEMCDDLWNIYFDIWMLQVLISNSQLLEIKKIFDEKNQSFSGDEVCLKILRNLKDNSKIKNSDKNRIYEEGSSIYPEKYKEWEKPIEEKTDTDIFQLSEKIIHKLRDIDISLGIDSCFELFWVFQDNELIKHLDQIDSLLQAKIKDSILKILDYIQLNEVNVTRTSETGFTFDRQLLYFYKVIEIGISLGLEDIIKSRFREKLIYFLPVDFSGVSRERSKDRLLFDLIGTITQEEEKALCESLSERTDDYMEISMSNFFSAIREFKLVSFSGFLKQYILRSNDSYYAKAALELLNEDFMCTEESFFYDVFMKFPKEEIQRDSLQELANSILILKFSNIDAANWRFDFLRRNIYEFLLYDFEGTRSVSSNESEMDRPTFCSCFIESKNANYASDFLDLIDYSLTLNTELKFKKYSEYLQRMSLDYYKTLGYRENIVSIRNVVDKHKNKLAIQNFLPLLRDTELYFVNQSQSINILTAVELYNKIKHSQYVLINNNTDLYYLVRKAIDDFRNIIKNGGLYKPIEFLSSEKYPNEDLLQKMLKLTLENSLFKLGIREIDIIREANLYDGKRTDILVKYGFIGPIMIELKLLDNNEIQIDEERTEYKEKLKQYIKGTYSEYSFYLIFQRKEATKTLLEKYENLKIEYSDISKLSIDFINCYMPKKIKQLIYKTNELNSNVLTNNIINATEIKFSCTKNTSEEIKEILRLIRKANPSTQKFLRQKLRSNYNFYISNFHNKLTDKDFDTQVVLGSIEIIKETKKINS